MNSRHGKLSKLNIEDNCQIKKRRKSKMNKGITLRGDVLIERRKKDGTVIDSEKLKNLIVNVGKERVARLICGDGSGIGAFGYIAIGTGTTSPAVGDTTLETEVARENATDAYEASYKATFEKTFSFGSGISYAITEAGVFDEASGGIMLDRFTFTQKDVDSDTDLYIKITITVS